MFPTYKMYINGEFVNSDSNDFYKVINPATEETIALVPNGNEQDVEKAVSAAREAFDKGDWPRMSPGERSLVLLKLADLVEHSIDKLAELESINQGKTIRYAKENDVPFVVDNLRFFAGAARNLQGLSSGEYVDQHTYKRHEGMGTSIIRREPIGVVGAIIPWNYPLSIAASKIGPALAAGNTIVIKPSSLTPLTTLELAKLVQRTDVPQGVFNVVTGTGETVGAALAKSSRVDMIAFTGDTATGKKIMSLASENVKKVHLELGGKAPFIVFEDADLEATVQGAIAGGFLNAGQDCTAAARIYVHDNIYHTFMKRLVEEAKKIRVGDPLDPAIDMGPLVSLKHWERVFAYIVSSKEQGVKILAGGKRPQGKEFAKGFFIEPTIITNVKDDMKICKEEVFGPVLTVQGFSTFDEVIERANDVIYGLAASVWTKNIAKALKAANKLRFGTVWINEHGVMASEMPHGGYKQSGFGKDLSVYALDEFTQIKHVYVDLTEMQRKPWYDFVYKPKRKNKEEREG